MESFRLLPLISIMTKILFLISVLLALACGDKNRAPALKPAIGIDSLPATPVILKQDSGIKTIHVFVAL
jgi:hypothetical protein